MSNSLLETKLSRLVRDSHQAVQMMAIGERSKLRGMKASFALETARKFRETADLLERAASND